MWVNCYRTVWNCVRTWFKLCVIPLISIVLNIILVKFFFNERSFSNYFTKLIIRLINCFNSPKCIKFALIDPQKLHVHIFLKRQELNSVKSFVHFSFLNSTSRENHWSFTNNFWFTDFFVHIFSLRVRELCLNRFNDRCPMKFPKKLFITRQPV